MVFLTGIDANVAYATYAVCLFQLGSSSLASSGWTFVQTLFHTFICHGAFIVLERCSNGIHLMDMHTIFDSNLDILFISDIH